MKKQTFNTFNLFLILAVVSALMLSPLFAQEGKRGNEKETLYSFVQTLPEATQLEIERIMETSPKLFAHKPGDHLQNLTDYTQWVCSELKLILDEGQYEKFIHLAVNPTKMEEDKLTRTMSGCSAPECYRIYMWRLGYAEIRLDNAIYAHDLATQSGNYNCDVPSYPNPIGLAMGQAAFYIDKAMPDTWDAYLYCDCDAAKAAKGYTKTAREKIISARLATEMHCPSYPTPSWLSDLTAAENYINLAYSTFPQCEAEACGN